LLIVLDFNSLKFDKVVKYGNTGERRNQGSNDVENVPVEQIFETLENPTIGLENISPILS